MSEVQTQSTCGAKQEAKTVAAVPMVTATITTLHEDKPIVVQVVKGTKVKAALEQANVGINQAWEVYIDGKLASLDTPINSNVEIYYVVRVAGGRY